MSQVKTLKPVAKAEANLGSNIHAAVEGNTLTLTIDLSKRLGQSKSGKTTIVASSGGNVTVPGTDVILGINAYVK